MIEEMIAEISHKAGRLLTGSSIFCVGGAQNYV